jgi:hypothetical protein
MNITSDEEYILSVEVDKCTGAVSFFVIKCVSHKASFTNESPYLIECLSKYTSKSWNKISEAHGCEDFLSDHRNYNSSGINYVAVDINFRVYK